MRKIKPLISIAAVLCLGSIALAGVNVGDPAVDFTLSDVNGTSHKLSDFEGKVVLLNFWQST